MTDARHDEPATDSGDDGVSAAESSGPSNAPLLILMLLGLVLTVTATVDAYLKAIGAASASDAVAEAGTASGADGSLGPWPMAGLALVASLVLLAGPPLIAGAITRNRSTVNMALAACCGLLAIGVLSSLAAPPSKPERLRRAQVELAELLQESSRLRDRFIKGEDTADAEAALKHRIDKTMGEIESLIEPSETAAGLVVAEHRIRLEKAQQEVTDAGKAVSDGRSLLTGDSIAVLRARFAKVDAYEQAIERHHRLIGKSPGLIEARLRDMQVDAKTIAEHAERERANLSDPSLRGMMAIKQQEPAAMREMLRYGIDFWGQWTMDRDRITFRTDAAEHAYRKLYKKQSDATSRMQALARTRTGEHAADHPPNGSQGIEDAEKVWLENAERRLAELNKQAQHGADVSEEYQRLSSEAAKRLEGTGAGSNPSERALSRAMAELVRDIGRARAAYDAASAPFAQSPMIDFRGLSSREACADRIKAIDAFIVANNQLAQVIRESPQKIRDRLKSDGLTEAKIEALVGGMRRAYSAQLSLRELESKFAATVREIVQLLDKHMGQWTIGPERLAIDDADAQRTYERLYQALEEQTRQSMSLERELGLE